MKKIPPSGFPYVWSSASGEDQFGLWLEFSLKNIVQRMRWINPGRFLMGSLDGELHRHHSETQHEVMLTKGFWLADTACTQELWQAVMEANPSKCAGAKKPVDNVSWDDCREFCKKANAEVKGPNLSLPTEAQWEYACRAGTTEPFSFGITITPVQVNYNGEFPYTGDKKDLNRGETVEVKSLPPNPWGLYEMHGNVWEWCSDWYGKFGEESVTDPVGPAEGKYRVLRGGSAYSGAADCRSAARSRCHTEGRFERNGFRFVWNPWPLPETNGKKTAQGLDDEKKDDVEEKETADFVVLPEKKMMAKNAIPPHNKKQKDERKK